MIKRFRPYFFLYFLLFVGFAEAEMKVINSMDKVVLMQEDHLDLQGNLIGKEYFVHNQNSYPIYVKIRLTKGTNVRNELTTMTKIVPPNQQMTLGDVWKDKNELNAEWDYDWFISRRPL